MSTTINIDPDGDVVLACKSAVEDGGRLRVSSKALSLGSPVFKAMLSEHFREGTELALHSAIGIPLPEDDSDAMEVLCNVLHLRNDALATSRDMPSEKVMLVASLSDKYDCREALRLVAEFWLPKCSPNSKLQDNKNLFIASYCFRNARAFYD